MGLRDTIQQAAVTALAAVGDLKTTVRYQSAIDQPQLNATTGVVSAGYYVYTGVEGVLAEYKESEIDGENILPRDQQFLLAGKGLSFKPKSDDRLIVPTDSGADEETWSVIGADLDPAGALWVLQIRRVQ